MPRRRVRASSEMKTNAANTPAGIREWSVDSHVFRRDLEAAHRRQDAAAHVTVERARMLGAIC